MRSSGMKRAGGAWSLLMGLALMGCGARTGLLEERVTTQLPDWRVSTVCQCGNCMTVPWCANAQGDFLCEINGTTCQCLDLGQTPINRPLASLTPNGEEKTLYCNGPANSAPDTSPALTPFGGARAGVLINASTACLASNDVLVRSGYFTASAVFDRASQCPGRYRCSTVPQDTGVSVAFADEVFCPKADAVGDPAVFVPGANATEAIANARPIVGALCALWSEPRFRGQSVPGSGSLPAYHCFARRGSSEQAIANAGMARRVDGVVVTDPGHAFGGDVCVAYQYYNYLRITRTSDNSYVTIPLSGTGSAATSSAGMALTDFQLNQVGTASFDGTTLSNTRVHLEDFWPGLPTATSGQFQVASADARVQGQYTLGSSTYSLRLTAMQNATMQWNGTWYTADGRFTSDDIGIVYDLHVELDLARARPTATVASAVDTECTSPDGALVSLQASWTASTATPRTAWTLNHHDGVRIANAGASVQILVPLLAPSSELLRAQFNVFDDPLTAIASTTVRVIDSAPPTLISSWAQVDCDWGGANDNQNDPKYCLGMNGATTDLCSSSTVYTQLVTQYLGCDRNAMIRQDNKACVRADPAHWGANISDIVYEIYFAPRDTWGNLGPSVHRSFRVIPQPPSAACAEPRAIVDNPCGWD